MSRNSRGRLASDGILFFRGENETLHFGVHKSNLNAGPILRGPGPGILGEIFCICRLKQRAANK